MAYCAVKRNSKGEIEKVVKENGAESQLFTTIAKHPAVDTMDKALTMFKNRFSKVIEGTVKDINKEKYKVALHNYRVTKKKLGTQLEAGEISQADYSRLKTEANQGLTKIQKTLKIKNSDFGIVSRDVKWDTKVKESLPLSSFRSTEELTNTLENESWGILTAENPMAMQITDVENYDNNEAAKAWLKSRGYVAQPIFGKYGNSENSFFVKGLTKAAAIEFAREFDQESVATDGGLIYQDGSFHPRTGVATGVDVSDLYSTIKTDEGNINFKIEYDFDTVEGKVEGKVIEEAPTEDYSEFEQEMDESEITFTHKVNGQLVSNYKEALQSAEEGEVIELGFKVAGKFYPILETRKNTNKNTQEGYINNIIEGGYLAEQKVKTRDGYVFEAAGTSELYKSMTSQLINDDVRAYLGVRGVKKDGYTFQFNKSKGNTTVTDSNGNLTNLSQAELNTLSYNELVNRFGRITANNIITEREFYASKEAYRDNTINLNTAEPTVSEEEMQLRLLNFLNKLGVKTMSIAEYTKKYKMKNGVAPSAKALADIANQIVAYTSGNLSELAEETAHFINEALPQDQVENVLRNIHHTQEWNEFSEIYRDIYSKEYPADMVENMVRREVLGKVVAKALLGTTPNATEVQKNIYSRVFEAVMEFFRNISNTMNRRPNVKEELNSYLQDVAKLMSQEDITDMVNTDNFKHNTFRFYSVGNSQDPIDKLRLRALALTDQLMDSEKTYMKTGAGRRTNVKELEKIQARLQTATEVSSIASLISMINSNVKGLEAAIKDSEKNNKSYFLSDEENILYQFVKGVGKKGIAQVTELVNKVNEAESNAEWKPILKELEATSNKIVNLEAKAELIDSKNVERLVNNILDKHNIPEGDRAAVTDWIERAQKDTNLFHATFGQLVHAQDGLLNLGGQLIRKMHNEAHAEFYSATKKFQEKLSQLGVSESELSSLRDGNYIISETDFNSFNNKMDEIFSTSYKQATNEAIPELQSQVTTLESNTNRSEVENNQLEMLKERLSTYQSYQGMDIVELTKLKNNYELMALSLSEETNRKNIERPLKIPEIERVMEDAYYTEYEAKLKAAGVSKVTQQKLSNIIGDLSDLKKKAFRKVGNRTILDHNSLSEADLVRLSDLQKERKALKSFTDELGQLKPGLEYDIDNNGEIKLDPTTKKPIVLIANQAAMTDDSIAAWDINKLDALLDNKFEQQAAKLFYQVLDEVDASEGRESAIRFLELNSFMSFKNEFWDSLGSSESVIDKLKKFQPESIADRREVNAIKNGLIVANFELKNILKTYNKKGNPAEINADLMTPQVKAKVLNLREEIKTLNSRARIFTKQLEETEEEAVNNALGASDINEAYRTHLEGEGFLQEPGDSDAISLMKAKEEMDLSRTNTTTSDYKAITDIDFSISRYVIGSATDVSKATTQILDELGYAVEDLQQEAVYAEVLRTAVRSRLAPYYKRYAPKAYTVFMENLKTAPSISAALKGKEAQDVMVDINPNYSFFDTQSNDKLNPNYDNNFDGGYLQPAKGKYTSQKFTEKFGTISTDANGNKVASKNVNLYQAYLAMLDYNKNALEAQNVGESHNKFMMPQIRKNTVERFKTANKGNIKENVGNFVKDALNFTDDEMAQGDKMYGNGVKVIPKMYVRPVEDPNDVSSELFYSMTLRAKEAYMRKAKVSSYGDLMSIHDKILTRDMNGKDQRASKTYTMFQSALDYNLFGIKETATYPVKTPFGTVDLTKVARQLLNFVKFRNLGLNAVIPITSLLTGTVTRKIEAFVGEFVDTKSQKAGAREFAKISVDGMKEMGVVNTKAKINVLGQFFKAFDLNESFKNSNYGFMLRNMPRAAMALHSAANYPLYGKILLGVLHDFRVVDGQVMNKTKFKRIQKNNNPGSAVNSKSIDAQWETYSGKAIYNYIKHEGNEVSFDEAALSKELMEGGLPLTGEALTAKIKEIHNEIQGNVQYVNSIIDGQIPEDDRVLAQRHYLLSYFMTHRGWLSIQLARKFKNKHLNLDTGVVEEGTYRSLFNYLGDVTKEFKEGNKAALIANFKKIWDEGDETTRRNLKRVGIELGALSTLMVLALALRAAAEDDDNEDLFALQLTNYLTFRTLNELSSTQFNIVTNFSDTIEAPFVGWNTMKNLVQIGDVFSTDEVKYGNYKGMTESGRWLTKMVPGMKQVFDLQNMNQTYDTYKFYNRSNFSLAPANMLWSRTIDAKEE